MLNDTHIAFVDAGEILAAAIVLPLLGALIVGCRFWVRLSFKQGLRADDWTIVVAVPMVIGMGVCLIWGVARKSVGYPSTPYPVPMPNPADEELTETTPQQDVVFIVYWVVWLLMIPANGFIKLSAIFMYRRIFVVAHLGLFDILTRFMLIVCLLWTIGFELAQAFGCGKDFYKPFGSLAEVASCNTNIRLNALMTSDLVTDILVWLMPMIVVWRLRMSTARKISVTAVFSLAAVSLVAAIIRLMIELEIANGGYDSAIDTDCMRSFYSTLNSTKLIAVVVLTNNLYWSMLESGLALIAACLPVTCMPAVRLVVHRKVHASATYLRRTLSTYKHRTKRDDSLSLDSDLVSTNIYYDSKDSGEEIAKISNVEGQTGSID